MIYSLPFVFYYPCPPLFDCGTFCIAVSFSWYRFYRATHLLKVSWKGGDVNCAPPPLCFLLPLRYENQLIVATGKGEPAVVMSEYGFKKVVSLDEYASCFENIDPLAQYKKWTTKQGLDRSSLTLNTVPRYDVSSETVKAVFVVSDPVDWGRDIQVLCDVLRCGGLPGQENGHQPQPPLYFAADDLEYQAAFPSNRLGMGAFRIALESVFNRIHYNPLEYVCFGKPDPFVFKNAEAMLKQLQPSYHSDNFKEPGDSGLRSFKTLYMIGDNPSVDVKGAQQAGHPWFSILTRTGVFRGKHNHAEFPADLASQTMKLSACCKLIFINMMGSHVSPLTNYPGY
eukprot:XP_024465741.1 uncharacterized CDP-alcohol phosphatidyltransferase class-I family protein C22A12.08c isoform X4 [Populus trichocarpa]